MRRFLLLALAALPLAGCYTYAPPRYAYYRPAVGCVWVPGTQP